MESFCYPELFFTLSEPCRKQFQQHTKLTEVLVKAAPLLLQIGDLLLQEGEFFLAGPGQEAQLFKLLPEAALLQLESGLSKLCEEAWLSEELSPTQQHATY